MEQLETETDDWWMDGRNVSALANWYTVSVALGDFPSHEPANVAMTIYGIYETPDVYTDLWCRFLDARPVG